MAQHADLNVTLPYGNLPATVREHIKRARQHTNASLPGVKHARLTAKTPIRFTHLTDVGVGYEALGRLGGLYFDRHPELAQALGL